MPNWLPPWIAGFLAAIAATAAEPPRPIRIDAIPGMGSAQWSLPRGEHVANGVPFQLQSNCPFEVIGRDRNSPPIPIGGTCERFYFLAAASGPDNDGATLARFRIQYADGTEAAPPLIYGRQLRDWMGPRHAVEPPLLHPDSQVVWQVEHSSASRKDASIRWFFFSLANPSPEKEVESVAFASAGARAGLLLGALSVGPQEFDRIEDTLPPPRQHSHRNGLQPAILTGRIHYNRAGLSTDDTIVRITAVRPVDTTNEISRADVEFVGREVTPASDGTYRFENLSSRLLYTLMFSAPGWSLAFYDRADPLAGPVNVSLGAISNQARDGTDYPRGRLTGPDDRPVAGAMISVDAFSPEANYWIEGDRFRESDRDSFPADIMSGTNGEFVVIGGAQDLKVVSVNVVAPKLAPAKVWLGASNGVQNVRMDVGVSVTGRLLKGDRPIAGIKIYMSGTNRHTAVFVGNYSAFTDPKGQFKFDLLPPNAGYVIWVRSPHLAREGVLVPRRFRVQGHGTSVDLGDLLVEPSITLAGQAKSADSQPLPPAMRFLLTMDPDWQVVECDRDGRFEATGLRTGLVQLASYDRAWRFTAENRSVDERSSARLTGQLLGEKRDLVLLLSRETYASDEIEYTAILDGDRSIHRSISGVETSGPPAIVLAGVVLDDQSGQPITNAVIFPGYHRSGPSWRRPAGGRYWESSHGRKLSDGRFSLAFRHLSSPPMLFATVEGYKASETGPYSFSQSNLVLRLEREFSPTGVLLDPDGQQVPGVRIGFGGATESFAILPSGNLQLIGDGNTMQVTEADGRFSFRPKPGAPRVLAGNSSGWASVRVKDWPSDGRIQMQPWAKVTGVLLAPNGQPMAGIELSVGQTGAADQNEQPIRLAHGSITDNTGRFTFFRVPPGTVELSRIILDGKDGQRYLRVKNFTAKPGESVDLGTIRLTPDQAAPPSR